MTLVSIHAPARGATAEEIYHLSDMWFQFTLPRGERQGGEARCPTCNAVSIHAPARGATSVRICPGSISVFQFTLPRGERPMSSHQTPPRGSFNSRSREGSDGVRIRDGKRPVVSIHAPARGATAKYDSLGRAVKCFNSRSREGSDVVFLTPLEDRWVSIHAPARGATAMQQADSEDWSEFQFTLPRGERP